MELTPEDQKIPLPPAELKAKYLEKKLDAMFKVTCYPKTVKSTRSAPSLPLNQQHEKVSKWEFFEFRDKLTHAKQAKLKWRDTEREENEWEVIWFRDTDGTIFYADNLDLSMLKIEGL